MKKTIIFLAFFLFISKLFADSPITSTVFYTHYSDNPIVEQASKSKVINDTIADYLLSDTVAIEVKAAIINALSWDIGGKNNTSLMMPYIMKKYGFSNGFDMNLLSADDIFCLGYLTIMDDYFSTEKPIKILTLASNKKPKSFTIQMILALVVAQRDLDSDWCSVYKDCDNVRKDKSLTKDMKKQAIDSIFSYINDYKSYCNEKK